MKGLLILGGEMEGFKIACKKIHGGERNEGFSHGSGCEEEESF